MRLQAALPLGARESTTARRSFSIEVETDAGIVGIGESVASPVIAPVQAILEDAIPHFVGQSVYDGNRTDLELLPGTASTRRARAARRATSRRRSPASSWRCGTPSARPPGCRCTSCSAAPCATRFEYFGFVQGDTPRELAAHARELAQAGFKVLYVKVGRGDELDVAIVSEVRKAVGDEVRLRLDANEAWDMLTARRMFAKLEPFDPEFIEQPVPGRTGLGRACRGCAR